MRERNIDGIAYYALECDEPDCGILYEGRERDWYWDARDLTDDARHDGWRILRIIEPTVEYDAQYCPKHAHPRLPDPPHSAV